MVDDIVLLDSTNNEDGVSFTLGIMLEVTEVYKIVGDCNTEEELDTEGVSSNEDKRDDDATDVMVISTPLLDVEMVIGEVNEASLRGNGVDDKCLVVVDVGSKTVDSDWLDFIVLVTAYDDMLVTTLPWLLRLPTVVVGGRMPRLTSDASIPPSVKLPLPSKSGVFVSSPAALVG